MDTLLRDIQKFYERIQYKPHWKFSISEDGFGNFVLRIERPEPDSRNPEETMNLIVTYRYPREAMAHGEEMWFGALKELITQTEIHEMNEWIKFDGEICSDPHTEVRTH